ncbi:DsbA family protein [Deinococcus pimensis]|uniref:DsbA family protein n=1 Tax=Deinococcus pimensis TaxID=309888 RepID=UPI00048273EB|nr:thioredoxin domain-containing protein [Deinococcus pimensis]
MTAGGPSGSRGLVVGTLVVLVLAVAGYFVYRSTQGAQAGTGRVDVTGQPTLGGTSAKAQIVVFEDFKCPNCQRYDAEVYPQVRSELVDKGLATYTFVNFPFLGPDSRTAAIAGECVARQNAELFWPYKDLVYRAQGPETTEWATPDRLVELANIVEGIDTGALRTCIDDSATAAAVDADLALVKQYEVTGTPTVLVNGAKVTATFDAIRQAVEGASE